MSAATATSRQANERQVGGDHYRPSGDASGLQHWDMFGVEYLNGCASKYVSRHMSKNGREDLEKAIHYCEKAAEVKGDRTITNTLRVERLLEWARGTKMGPRELEICHEILCRTRYDRAVQLLHLLIRQCYPDTLTGSEGYRKAIQEGCDAVNASIAQNNKYVEGKFSHYESSREHPDPLGSYGPGTPEDGGHHARQPPDRIDDDSGEVIRDWSWADAMHKTLPPSLSQHEWQHRCAAAVQCLYEYDVSAARYLIKDEHRAMTHHCTARD